MTGHISRRGTKSWRLKFEAGPRDPITGKRRTRFVTIRGTKREAQAELIRLLAEVENGRSRSVQAHGHGICPGMVG
jgi:hypothetical protein